MKLKAARIVFEVGILVFLFLVPNLLRAQTAAATLSGAITDSSGKIVPNAKVSIKNVETGQSTQTQTNAASVYIARDLSPGDYAVSVSAEGFAAKTSDVTVAGGARNTANLVLQAGQPELPAAPQPASQAAPPNAPSMQSLGFPASQTQGSAQEQAQLNRRTHMLKVHQTLGLITLAPMVATVFTGGGAKAKRSRVPGGPSVIEPGSTALDTHVALGAATGVLYAATAYYAIFAPKVPGVKPKGAIRLHRDLEWVHGPGMVLTGILGIMAYQQENAGEKVHGIASQHGTAADVTLVAYAASIVAVSWPIHLKFWER